MRSSPVLSSDVRSGYTAQTGDPGARPGSAPLAAARAGQPTPVLPPAALDFLAHFYPRGKVAPQRRRDAYDQVLKTLTVGARFGRGRNARVAFALTPQRLAAKCTEVMQESIRDPDKAIVVLLTKLADTTSVLEAQARDAKAQRTADESEGRNRLLEAEAWLVSDCDAARSALALLGKPQSTHDRDQLKKPERIGAISASWERTVRLLELFTAWEATQS